MNQEVLTLMNGDYLLDANVIIDVFQGKAKVIARVRNLSRIYVPVIVLGELCFGANKSNQTLKRLQEIEQLERNTIYSTLCGVGKTPLSFLRITFGAIHVQPLSGLDYVIARRGCLKRLFLPYPLVRRRANSR